MKRLETPIFKYLFMDRNGKILSTKPDRNDIQISRNREQLYFEIKPDQMNAFYDGGKVNIESLQKTEEQYHLNKIQLEKLLYSYALIHDTVVLTDELQKQILFVKNRESGILINEFPILTKHMSQYLLPEHHQGRKHLHLMKINKYHFISSTFNITRINENLFETHCSSMESDLEHLIQNCKVKRL